MSILYIYWLGPSTAMMMLVAVNTAMQHATDSTVKKKHVISHQLRRHCHFADCLRFDSQLHRQWQHAHVLMTNSSFEGMLVCSARFQAEATASPRRPFPSTTSLQPRLRGHQTNWAKQCYTHANAYYGALRCKPEYLHIGFRFHPMLRANLGMPHVLRKTYQQ